MNSALKFILFVFLMAFVLSNAIGQSSFRKKLETAGSDTAKIRILIAAVTDAYKESNDKEQEKYLKELFLLAKKCNDKNGQAAFYYFKGYLNLHQHKTDSTDYFFKKAYDIYLSLRDNLNSADALYGLGQAYEADHKQAMALSCYFKALKIYEDLGQLHSASDVYNQIAYIYSLQDDYSSSLIYFKQGLEISIKSLDSSEISDFYNNIGLCYNVLDSLDQAKEYYNIAIEIREKIRDSVGIAQSYNNLGILFFKEKNYNESLRCLNTAMLIKEKLNRPQDLVTTYMNIGELYRNMGNIQRSVEYYLKSEKTARQINDNYNLIEIYKGISETYAGSGQFSLAYDFLGKAMTLNDTIFTIETQKQISELKTRFETEKKQLLIAKLNKEKELQQSEILRQQETGRRQELVIFFIIAGLLLVAAFAVFVVHRLRITSKQKKIIEKQKIEVDEKNSILNQQNEEILTQKHEIEAQRDEIVAQRDLVTQQRDHIKEQKQEITDSITYAKRIQSAMLPDLDKIFSGCDPEPDFFVLFRPRDIVSGDFYWATRINEWLIFAVADCTGHGVPGAFMSMLGVSFLNETFRKKEVTKASEVLNHLRESVIEALQQTGEGQEQKDGMDIALCVLNTKTKILQFAGANNPLYIIKNDHSPRPLAVGKTETETSGQQSIDNSRLTEIKPDSQPVGIHIKMLPFSNNEIQLNKDDCIYLFTDGFEDQFGGPKNRKFMARQLKQVLVEISGKPMEQQREILDDTFENWINAESDKSRQIDDVTILGLKIN